GHVIFQAKASDPDEGTNGMVVYSLKQNPRGLFHIHEKHGLITLTGPLEVTTSSYEVEVTASDMGVPQHTSSLILIISVYDVNDNSPVFDQLSYEVIILESEPVNSRFFKVEATDKDSGLNGEIMYDIAGGNTGDVFGIFPDGQLYIKAELDREIQDRYNLVVVAKDRAVEPLSATVNVSVILDDVNDNRPLFNSTNYVFHFEEEQKRGSLVGRVFAEDKDFGPNSEVRYTFETPQPNFELNAITGELTSTLQLDRESLMRQRGAAVFSFVVVSSDQGLPKPLRDQAKVQVYIQDINDNPPKFTKDIYQASISESAQNMTQLLRVSASDVDENKNGLVRYRITEGNEEGQFTIDSSSGQVTLVGKLDYESTSSYSLKIIAVDAGAVPLSSSCMLSISILDENDNSPSFPKSSLSVDVLENMRIGELVASVTATDADSGQNADITYSITATNNHGTFSISPNTGSIFLVKKLDYETQSFYKLNITAKDNGRPPPSVMTITAHDTDADINGQLEYSIVQQIPRGSHFSIDSSTGLIYTKKEIDREFSNLFELTVKATDQAVPLEFRRFALKNVTIWVTDQNDNVPTFISAECTRGRAQHCHRLHPDNSMEYFIVAVGADDSFRIDPESGDLIATKKLDRERRSKYSLLVRADDGKQSSDMRLNITVKDVNDHTPKFSRTTYSFDIPEDMAPGSIVAAILASDSDSGVNGEVTYSLEEDDEDETFLLNPVTGKALDRETQSFYNLVITVNDLAPPPMTRFTSTAQVSIILLDVNDCPPTFTSQKMTYIQENTPVDTVVFTAQATDADSGPNSYVEYSLRGPYGNKFSIGTVDGDVRLVGELDREELSNYTLTVVATDKGEPPLSSTMDVTMMVLDVNDNTPSFSQNIYDIEIEENTLTGTDVIQVFASDADEGTNGQIRFTISGGNTNSDFRIDSVTGVISVAKQLDREARSSYSLVVQAADRGSSPRVDRATVNIMLLDVNDCSPVFELSPYTVSVQENLESLPKNILQVSCVCFLFH
uniref:Cadherin domain-containing protein n=1 Tax=Lates calcarifer TaxID=8187 RepID=A0A4W6BX21_LATCA